MGGYELAYVAAVVEDATATADIFERDLGLARAAMAAGDGAVPVVRLGAVALALFEPGDPFLAGATRKGLHHMALVDRDPAAVLQRHGLAPEAGASARGLGGGRQAAVDPAATGGLRLRFVEPLDLPKPRAGAVERIDHVGVASADNETAIDLFARRLGCPIESRQTDVEVTIAMESFTSDKYGIVYQQRPPALAGGLRVAFLTVGDCDLEFLQDYDRALGAGAAMHDQAGTTKGDQGAIARYVARQGAGLHHLALKTPDIDGTLARLGSAGHRLIDRTGRPGSRRARIGFVHPSALGGLLVHFVEREPLP